MLSKLKIIKPFLFRAPDTQKAEKVPEVQWALLAGLRFFFASVVIWFHSWAILPISWTTGSMWLASFGGTQAVIAFLVVSGYSIAHSVDGSATGAFYERRFWRIAPVYLSCFALANLPFLIGGPAFHAAHLGYIRLPPFSSNGPASWILNALCLQMWVTPCLPTFNQSYTLAIEVTFYALAPFLWRLRARWLVAAIAASGILFFVRCITQMPNASLAMRGVPEAELAWAWIAGMLFYRFRNNALVRMWLPLCIVPMAMVDDRFYTPLGAFTVAALFAVLLNGDRVKLSAKSMAILSRLGDYSYPMYLSGTFVLYMFGMLLHAAPSWTWIAIYIAVIVTAAIIYYCVDVPVRAYRRWVGKKRIAEVERRTRLSTAPPLDTSSPSQTSNVSMPAID